ncbi:MAG: aminotransferase class I/II-fold pyridoxal phosphate-dependent enzyme [Nitrospirae bacterium]|nr:aminotransferase class I/II-fold pyridoxal phosphate-dependent enzyme [Nitrospirota bacterium]
MLRFVSEKIKNLVPYSPGKPLEELERELGIQGAIKLASYENPLRPALKALAAMEKGFKTLHRYPDGGGFYLKRALAAKWGVTPEEILLGTGSTAKISPRTRLIFVSNPNNPTGTMVTAEEVREFMGVLPPDVLVVFDEAYAEYATSKDYPETLPYLREGRNVAILRTFSKIYGLAGLRIGYGLLPAALADMANRVRQPFNTNSLAQLAALAALGDEEHVARSRRINEEGKSFLYREFDSLGIDYLPTEANFIYFKAPGGEGKGIFDALLRKGIIIRHMQGPNLRVTIGTPEENRRFIEAFREVLG